MLAALTGSEGGREGGRELGEAVTKDSTSNYLVPGGRR